MASMSLPPYFRSEAITRMARVSFQTGRNFSCRATFRDGMRAITLSPGIADSARLDDVSEPPPSDGAVLVRTLALGVCGTDREILSCAYGFAPPGEPRLVLGHESLGEVAAAPKNCGL